MKNPLPLLAVLAFFGLGPVAARAGGESSLDYAREFLARYPAFTAEGVMTSSPPGHKASSYRCRIQIEFDEKGSVKFLYNTNAAKNIIPYDYAYADRKLQETVYDRTRATVLSETEVGAPNRTVFNFVWDLLEEARKGAGLRSLVLGGLMSVDRTDTSRRTQITMERRFPSIPIKSVVFTFDDEQHLRSLVILQSDGMQHRIEILRFRPAKTD